MVRKFSHSGLSRSRGFLLLEVLISFVVGMLVICGVLSVFVWYAKFFLRTMRYLEQKEQALCAFHFAFHLARYGKDITITLNGRRLNLSLRNNRVALYPLNNSLLFAHKGTANPIAEGCTDALFSLSQGFLTLNFSFGEDGYALQVVPGYFRQ